MPSKNAPVEEKTPKTADNPFGITKQMKDYNLSKYYIWRTVQDGKVRSSHAANEGKIFNKDFPPDTGNPGKEFHCRCRAEPISPDADVPPEIRRLVGKLKYRDLFEFNLIQKYNLFLQKEHDLEETDREFADEGEKFIADENRDPEAIKNLIVRRERVMNAWEDGLAAMKEASRDVPVEGRRVYYISRPLLNFEGTLQSHNFIVLNAEYLGDPKATVVSFGKTSKGLLGVVDGKTTGTSKSTHGDDEDYWKKIKKHPESVKQVSNNSRLGREAVNAIKDGATMKYSIWGPNSNSAAQAVVDYMVLKERKGPITPPDGKRDSIGAGDSFTL